MFDLAKGFIFYTLLGLGDMNNPLINKNTGGRAHNASFSSKPKNGPSKLK